uniref:Uncharacterized protein n=1 Tax=Siphoviridae sp. cttdo1 TaxID=2823606 RepID=A0A8S5LC44_9CAUD|nr:MAG TPA: hypothetical protein [Siphoviridae sp. cttdo1]
MSLTANIYPATMALTGNPIKLSVNTTSLATYVIKEGNNIVYTGSGEGDFSIFIQDILAAIVQPATLYNESVDVLISATGSAKDITIAVTNTEGGEVTLTLKALIGGVSKRTLRRLNDENSNIFTWKLLNSEGNFFQTTRGTGRIFTLRETELLPIPFIYPDGELKVVASGITTTLPGTTGDPVALNLYRLRKNLFETSHVLASVFDIYSGEIKACTIVITPGTVSRERYLLQFLNSYGAYERIEVTGIGSIEHKAADEETYFVYDELVDDYVEARERQSGTGTLKVDSGYRSPEELVYLIDMLSSDDIKILGLDGRNIKVIATADNLASAARATTPESIKLTLRFAESEHHHTGSLLDDDFGSPRIHTEQFTPEFN